MAGFFKEFGNIFNRIIIASKKPLSAIVRYFKDGVYQKTLFSLLLFTEKEFITFTILSHNKRRNRPTWYFNNLIFPVGVILFPYFFTLLNRSGSPVAFNKGIIEILLGGSFTLLGINVVRTAATFISEKLDETNLPIDKDKIQQVKSRVNDLRNKMKNWVMGITFLGVAIYFSQILQYLNHTINGVEYYLFGVVALTGVSILIGRFTYLLETNYLEDSKIVELLFAKTISQADDFKALEDRISKLGGL